MLETKLFILQKALIVQSVASLMRSFVTVVDGTSSYFSSCLEGYYKDDISKPYDTFLNRRFNHFSMKSIAVK